jgi:hypothetical protein
MLQSLSTLSPPRRFGQPPDSRKYQLREFVDGVVGPACLFGERRQPRHIAVPVSDRRYRVKPVGDRWLPEWL